MSRKPFDVFISHPGDGGYKVTLALPLKEMFKTLDITAFVDEADLKQGMAAGKVMAATAASCKVFLVLIDNHHYIRSSNCMDELRAALARKDCIVAPVFLSRLDSYPVTVEASKRAVEDQLFKNSFEPRGWQRENLVGTIQAVLGLAGLRACEDKSFELAHVVISVQELLESGSGFSLPDLAKNEHVVERINKVKAMAAEQGKTSVFRRAHPIKLCKVPRVDEKSVDLHQTRYESVKTNLIAENKSASIVGVRGAGGVGKTWLAIRLGNDEDIREHFPDGVLFATFGEEERTSTDALRRLWTDLGGQDTLKDQLNVASARSWFAQLLSEREPKTLLILDDIWDERYLQVFKDVVNDHSTIKLLVTSRREEYINAAFSESCTIHSIHPRLTKGEALSLMRSFAPKKSLPDDEAAMLRVAGLIDFHPKALSILSTAVKYSRNWGDFADMLEESITEVPKAASAVKEVKKAIWFTFKKAFEDNAIAEERFLRMGSFVEDAFFSEDDVRHIWQDPKAGVAYNWLMMFIECSIVERARQGEGLFYLHDLVRQCAREENPSLTAKFEAEFLALMLRLVRRKQEGVTQYMFDWFEKHAGVCVEAQELRSAYESSARGVFDPEWSGNPVIVLRAVHFSSANLSHASISLLRDSKFLERALNAHAFFMYVKSRYRSVPK